MASQGESYEQAVAEVAAPVVDVTPEFQPQVYDVPEGVPQCAATCGLYLLSTMGREVIEKEPGLYPVRFAAAKVAQYRRIEATHGRVAQGCDGEGSDPNDWTSCPRSGLINSIVTVSCEASPDIEELPEPKGAKKPELPSEAPNDDGTGQYL